MKIPAALKSALALMTRPGLARPFAHQALRRFRVLQPPLHCALFQHAAAAVKRSAAAGENLIDIGGVAGVALDLIVMGKLLAGPYRAQRFYENPLAAIDAFAIGVAAVVHEARFIAVDPGVDHRLRVDGEQKCVVVPGILFLIAGVRLAVAQPIAKILEDGGAFADPPPREYAVTVNG